MERYQAYYLSCSNMQVFSLGVKRKDTSFRCEPEAADTWMTAWWRPLEAAWGQLCCTVHLTTPTSAACVHKPHKDAHWRRLISQKEKKSAKRKSNQIIIVKVWFCLIDPDLWPPQCSGEQVRSGQRWGFCYGETLQEKNNRELFLEVWDWLIRF